MAESHDYSHVRVFKWYYGSERRDQSYVVYELNCGPNWRETYLDLEPFGIVDEVRMQPDQNGVSQVYRGLDDPLASKSDRRGIPKVFETRFADILEAIRPTVDVDSMPWCDISGRVPVKSKTARQPGQAASLPFHLQGGSTAVTMAGGLVSGGETTAEVFF